MVSSLSMFQQPRTLFVDVFECESREGGTCRENIDSATADDQGRHVVGQKRILSFT